MDRFVHVLNGHKDEVIERKSKEAASTFKFDHVLTINDFAQIIEDSVDDKKPSDRISQATTFCGIPQNLLLPRYTK